MRAPAFSAAMRVACVSLCGLMLLGADFDVIEVPTRQSHVEAFFSKVDAEAPPKLIILSGRTLTIQHALRPPRTNAYRLKPGTSVIDIADTDGDGMAELFSVAGNEVYRTVLTPGPAVEPARLLFKHDSLLSRSTQNPRPYVLVKEWKGKSVFALPTLSGMDFVALDGTVVDHFEHEAFETRRALPLTAWALDTPQIGTPGSLEFRVDTVFEAPLPLPEPLAMPEVAQKPARRFSYYHARQAASSGVDEWPWFALRPNTKEQVRVLYALPSAGKETTTVRFRIPERRDMPGDAATHYVSPKRRYPGAIVIPPTSPPDFNGDGYSDLLLWSAPRPGTSVDSLMRAAHERTWPVRLTVHHFSPADQRYAPRPSARIDLRTSVGWMLDAESGPPFRHFLIDDLNGDGYSDVGLAPTPMRFDLWLYQPGRGFSEKPDFSAELPQAVDALVFHATAGEGSEALIALQAEKTVYILSLP